MIMVVLQLFRKHSLIDRTVKIRESLSIREGRRETTECYAAHEDGLEMVCGKEKCQR
jgi:hypothetical protein